MANRELSVSAAVLAVMIAGSLRAEAHEETKVRAEKVTVKREPVVVKVAEDRYQIARGSMPVDADAPRDVVRIIPFFREGRAEGMKLYAMRPGSPLMEAGLKNKDVVRSVAGIAVTTPEACKDAYERARESDTFEVVIERDGERKVIHYEVR